MTGGVKSVIPGIKGSAAPEPTIGAGFVRALLDLAVSKGANREELAARAGIDSAQLGDTDARIPFSHYAALMRAGKELAGDPALGLHFGETYEMADLSVVGLIGRASETMAEAFAQFNRYARLTADVGGGPERFTLERRDGLLWMIDTREDANAFPEHSEASFARMVTTSRRWLGDTSFMKAVHFTHTAPPYRAEYDRIFGFDVIFESDVNALVTDETWLTRKTLHASTYVFGVLSERAGALLASLEASDSVRARVESFIMPMLHTGEASMDRVAAKMGVSRPTLFRRLKGEGVTFEKVLDDLRHKLAQHYLSGEKVSVNEAAYLVGFSDRAAFSRAFKRWTGSSPRASKT